MMIPVKNLTACAKSADGRPSWISLARTRNYLAGIIKQQLSERLHLCQREAAPRCRRRDERGFLPLGPPGGLALSSITPPRALPSPWRQAHGPKPPSRPWWAWCRA